MAESKTVSEAQSNEQPSQTSPKWFHFRGRVLLLIPVAVLVLAAIYVPRQLAQGRALVALKAKAIPVRTQPLSVPGVAQLFGEDYAQEITDVYMRNPEISDQDLHIVAGLPTLEKLELAGSSVTSAGIENLKSLPKLYTLHLADTQVTDEGLAHLPRFRSLGILSLDNTAITDAGLVSVAKIPMLERLSLDGTGITDAGLAHLSGLATLKELACVDTKITDEGLVHLEGLKNLEVLKVYNTKVTRAALEKLHVVLPNCMIWEPDE